CAGAVELRWLSGAGRARHRSASIASKGNRHTLIILKRCLRCEARSLTDRAQSKYSAEVDLLRGKLSDHEVTLLVCDRREENVRIFFGEFVQAKLHLFVWLKAAAS